MARLAQLLRDSQRNGVYRFTGTAATIASAAADAGLTLVRLDLGTARGKNGLFDAFAASLRFPDYFGRNWDALDECLRDLEWLDAPGWVLIIANSAKYAAKNRESFAVAIEVLQNAAEHWRSAGKPFWVVLLKPAKMRLPELPQLLENQADD